MSGLFRLLDSLFDKADSPSQAVEQAHDGQFMIVAGLFALLLIAMAVGGFAFFRQQLHQPESHAGQAVEAALWNDLLADLSSCGLEKSGPQLQNEDLRTLALFAAARFNCPEVVLHLLSVGANLDDRRYINGRTQSVMDYAKEFNAISVLEILSAESARRREEMKQFTAKKPEPKTEAPGGDPRSLFEEENRRHQQTLHVIALEHAGLRKSIHYEKARIDCELLQERLGVGAATFDLVGCIRKGIKQRRMDRKEQGHIVPP